MAMDLCEAIYLVPGTGLEPASREAADFKSAMFTNFITPAGVEPHVDANSTIARRARQTGAVQPLSIPTPPAKDQIGVIRTS
jgi:hypothetical protein